MMALPENAIAPSVASSNPEATEVGGAGVEGCIIQVLTGRCR